MYRFDLLLSTIVLCTWLRLVVSFKYTATFGPMFKMIEKMTIDLMRFVTLWFMMLIMFACVALLAFG